MLKTFCFSFFFRYHESLIHFSTVYVVYQQLTYDSEYIQAGAMNYLEVEISYESSYRRVLHWSRSCMCWWVCSFSGFNLNMNFENFLSYVVKWKLVAFSKWTYIAQDNFSPGCTKLFLWVLFLFQLLTACISQN